jgi:hypothetical protein
MPPKIKITKITKITKKVVVPEVVVPKVVVPKVVVPKVVVPKVVVPELTVDKFNKEQNSKNKKILNIRNDYYSHKFQYAIKQLELQKYMDPETTSTDTSGLQNIRDTRNCKYSNLFIHKPKRTSYMYQACKEMSYSWDAECNAIANE